MRYRYSRQLLMYNGYWYEWYPAEWAEEEMEKNNEDSSQVSVEDADTAGEDSAG